MNARRTDTKVLPVAAGVAGPVRARDHVAARHGSRPDAARVGGGRGGAGVGRRWLRARGWVARLAGRFAGVSR